MSTVRLNGVDLRGNGPPVVPLAGTGYPGASWPAGFLHRPSREHAVLTFDHRGVGASQDSDGPYSTRMLAADAPPLVGRIFGAPADVVGHSMGGRVAHWMALDAPAAVRSLILAATGPGPLPETSGQQTGLPLRTVARMVEMGYEQFIRVSQQKNFFTDSFAERCPEEVDWLYSTWQSHHPSRHYYLKHVLTRQQHDTAARLSEISQPALVLGGADTALMGTRSHMEQSHYPASGLPQAVLKVLPGLKHGLFWEAPDESADAVVSWVDHGQQLHASRPADTYAAGNATTAATQEDHR